MKTETRKIISLQAWDDLVSETYGKEYRLQQQDGCQDRGTKYLTVPSSRPDDFENDAVPEVINGEEPGVSFAAWVARDPTEWNGDPEDERYLGLFWLRNFYPSLEMVANDLHARGLLPAGEYVIDIDW